MTKKVWVLDEIITVAESAKLLYNNANGESADDLTKLAVKDNSGAGGFALELLATEVLTADRILTLIVNNAARSINLTGDITLAGGLTTGGAVAFSGAFGCTLTVTALTAVTLPTTGTLATLGGTETLTAKTLTAPDINAGTADSLTSLSIRSTGAAFDVLLATSAVYTANRTLTINIPDANAALTLTGDLIRIGGHSLTLRTSAITDVTLPTTGTLITSGVTALASLVTVGTIGTGTWQAGIVDVPYGGTGLATLTDHGVLLGSGTGAITPLAPSGATAGRILRSGGVAADPYWSTATFPNVTSTNRLLVSVNPNQIDELSTANSGVLVTSGTGVPSIGTDLPTAITIGAAYIYRAGGTDIPLADGGTNASLVAANGGVIYSDAAALAISAVGAAGQVLTSAGAAAPVWTTATYPATTTINQILYSSAANTIAAIATANSGILITSGAGVPSIGTDLPTAITIGAGYVYRAGGTDIAVADGGTGLGAYTIGDILHATGAGVLAGLADVAVGQVLCSGGVGVIGAWSASPVLTGRLETARMNLTDDTLITLDANGVALVTQTYHNFDTFAAAASDDLDGIDGTVEGDIVIFRPTNAARTIVARHGQAPASGKALNLSAGANFTMDEDDDWLMVLDDGTLMQEISRSENHA